MAPTRGLRLALPLLVALVAPAALAACGRPTDPGAGSELRVVAARPELRLTNRADRPVYTFVVGRQASASINWAPCVAPECGRIAPGGTRAVPYPPPALVTGYAAETEALVFWWHAVPGPGGRLQPDSPRGLIVRL
jgi:hypothetical protein